MFRGKESSNNRIISISSRLIEFWCFGLPVALGRGQMGLGCLGASGVMGVSPPHMHMHVYADAHTHVYMYRNCKWQPTWRHPCLACLTCMYVCVYMHVHVCMHGTPPTHPYPPPPPSTHLPPPRRGPLESVKIR